MRILIAHAAAGYRERARLLLEPLGHEVRDRPDGPSALAACADWAPDVALVQRSMDLLGAIKGDSDAYGTAVILLCEEEMTLAESLEAMRSGAHDFLVGAEPPEGEIVVRVEAAGRTKDLQEALLGQARRIEQQVFEDPLTGLLNRRAVLSQLEALISGSRRHGRELSILILDVDHFKPFNDAHGHQAGDRALVSVAQRLRGRVRSEDWLGRIGGEEFLALLPDTGAAEAARVAEDLRECVAATPVELSGGPVPVTVSIGWAAWDGGTSNELMRRADEALYAAKHAGRNAVRGAGRPATLRDRP